MQNYYSENLNALNLKKCYEVAPARVRQFLEAEIAFVLSRIQQNDSVLDLGCGYGRVAVRLVEVARQVTGIDISPDNIKLAKEMYNNDSLRFYEMNAIDLSFEEGRFDLTICIQNGISAFKVNPAALVKEALRVTRKGGMMLFSSYSGKFWEERLKWFEIQSDNQLIGEIDHEQTKNGTIVCKDGFRATTFSEQDFLKLASGFNVAAQVFEIDNSSVFCEMIKN